MYWGLGHLERKHSIQTSPLRLLTIFSARNIYQNTGMTWTLAAHF